MAPITAIGAITESGPNRMPGPTGPAADVVAPVGSALAIIDRPHPPCGRILELAGRSRDM